MTPDVPPTHPSSLARPSGRRRPTDPLRAATRSATVVIPVTVGLLVIGVLSWTGPARATPVPDDCRSGLVDTAGVVDETDVELALAEIDFDRVGSDASVTMRVWPEAPGGDLIGAVDALVADCFGDAQGDIEPEIAIIALSVADRSSDVLVGARWVAVGLDADRLRADVMGPGLADDDYTTALVEAALALAELADGLPPPVESIDEPADLDEPAAGPATVDRSAWAIAAGLGVVGACGGAVAVIHRRRRLARSRERVRRSLEPVLGRLRLLRERDDRLATEANGWYQISAGRTKTTLGTLIREAEGARRITDRAAGMVQQSLPDGLGRAGMEQLAQAQTRIAELARAAGDHATILDRLSALGARVDHLRVAVPAKAELLATELPEVRAAANRRLEDGWDVTEHRARLSDVLAAVEEVRLADSQLEIDALELFDRIERAEAELFAIDHDLGSLEETVVSLRAWADGLLAAVDHEHERVQEARRQLGRAANHHAPRSWTWAGDQPEQAAEHLEAAVALIERTAADLVVQQHLDEAGRRLDRAGLEIIAADDLLDEVDDLLVDLDRARTEGPAIVAEARRVLDQLTAFVAEHRVDLGAETVERSRHLPGVVAGLERELARPKPDHLQVAEAGHRLSAEMDGLLAQAEDERLATEALRRELARERARAARALARARRSLGWQLLPTADGAVLDRLEAALGSLPADLTVAVEAVAEIADDALRVQERIIARRRRRSMAVSLGGSSPVPGRGGWSGGGSDRPDLRVNGRSMAPPAPTWSSGSRSFGGGRRSSGARSRGAGRSSGRF